MSADITIADKVGTVSGQYGRVYYFEGNIFMPLTIHGGDAGRVNGAIKRFIKQNRERIRADRARPDYKTLTQLFDEQVAG